MELEAERDVEGLEPVGQRAAHVQAAGEEPALHDLDEVGHVLAADGRVVGHDHHEALEAARPVVDLDELTRQ